MGKKLVAARPLAAGHVLAPGDLVARSPADEGLPPYALDALLGRSLAGALAEDEAILAADVGCRHRGRCRDAVTPPPDDDLHAVGLVVFDFDGVFTDNRVWVNEDGDESVACWRGDGIGLRRLDEVGVQYLIVSTEPNPVVAHRAKKLEARCIHGVTDKLAVLREEASAAGVGLETVA